MANKVTKIVVVGAGSMCFGGSIVRDLYTFREELRGSTVSLVDINPHAASKMYDLLRRVCDDHYNVDIATDLDTVISGAEFVMNAVAIDRNRLWRHDLEIPLKHGLMQSLGENGGPGGLFFTMRTLPLVTDIARTVYEKAPNALFINYSNPESRIVCALGRLLPKQKAIGLCHGIFIAQDWVASVLGRKNADGTVDKKSVEVWGAGVNHLQWLLHIRDRDTGRDLYPELRAAEQRIRDERLPRGEKPWDPIVTDLFREFGYWPSPCSTHVGEFLPYGADYEIDHNCYKHAEREAHEFWKGVSRAIDNRHPLEEYWRVPSGEKGVEIIAAIMHNKKQFVESAVVYNCGVIPNLPFDCAVEVPVVCDAAGVHPVSLGPLPLPLARKLVPVANAQQFSVDAAIAGTKEAAWQAFVSDPVVTSHDAAQAAFEELWEINKAYIRPCR